MTLANFASPALRTRCVLWPKGRIRTMWPASLTWPSFAAVLLRSERCWWGRTLAIGYLPLGFASVLLTASRSGFVNAWLPRWVRGHPLANQSSRDLQWVRCNCVFCIPSLAGRSARHDRSHRHHSEQLMGGDLNQRINIWVAGWRTFVDAPLIGSAPGPSLPRRVLRALTRPQHCSRAGGRGWPHSLALAVGIVVSASRSLLLMRA